MSFERYLVPESSQREVLREALFRCLEALDGDGFEFVESAYRESGSCRVTRFSDEPETSHIELWEDAVSEVRHLRLEAPDPAGLARLVGVLASHIPMASHEAFCASMGVSAEPLLLYRIGYSAPTEPRAETVRIIGDALRSRSPELATAAAEVAGILGWEAFVEPLTSLEKTAEAGPFRDAVRRALAVLSYDDESETPT